MSSVSRRVGINRPLSHAQAALGLVPLPCTDLSCCLLSSGGGQISLTVVPTCAVSWAQRQPSPGREPWTPEMGVRADNVWVEVLCSEAGIGEGKATSRC